MPSTIYVVRYVKTVSNGDAGGLRDALARYVDGEIRAFTKDSLAIEFVEEWRASFGAPDSVWQAEKLVGEDVGVVWTFVYPEGGLGSAISLAMIPLV